MRRTPPLSRRGSRTRVLSPIGPDVFIQRSFRSRTRFLPVRPGALLNELHSATQTRRSAKTVTRLTRVTHAAFTACAAGFEPARAFALTMYSAPAFTVFFFSTLRLAGELAHRLHPRRASSPATRRFPIQRPTTVDETLQVICSPIGIRPLRLSAFAQDRPLRLTLRTGLKRASVGYRRPHTGMRSVTSVKCSRR